MFDMNIQPVYFNDHRSLFFLILTKLHNETSAKSVENLLVYHDQWVCSST